MRKDFSKWFLLKQAAHEEESKLDTCIVIPLTAKPKTGKYYFSIGTIHEHDAVVVLSQIRLIDRKRLAEKIETLPKAKFKELLNAIIKTNFTYQDRI